MEELGFEILRISEVSISINGEQELFQDIFGTTLVSRSMIKADVPDGAVLVPQIAEFYDYGDEEPTVEAL